MLFLLLQIFLIIYVLIPRLANTWQLAIAVGYETYFVSRRGGTLGKLALGLRVIRADGTNEAVLQQPLLAESGGGGIQLPAKRYVFC